MSTSIVTLNAAADNPIPLLAPLTFAWHTFTTMNIRKIFYLLPFLDIKNVQGRCSGVAQSCSTIYRASTCTDFIGGPRTCDTFLGACESICERSGATDYNSPCSCRSRSAGCDSNSCDRRITCEGFANCAALDNSLDCGLTRGCTWTPPATPPPTVSPVASPTDTMPTMPTDNTPTSPADNTPTGPADNTPTNPTQTIEEFCSDLTSVEAHLVKEFETQIQLPLTRSFTCSCSTPSNAALQLDCPGQYELEGQTFDNHERAIFQELANGELYLSQTAWGDTQLVIPGNFQEIYNFGPDGILDNCAGSGCNSCSACPGGEFYSLDCSGLPNDLSYSFSCSDNYIGSFFNTFESATTIVRNPESTAPPAFGPTQTIEEFCSDLTSVEAHLVKEFETQIQLPLTRSFTCSCSTPSNAALQLDCPGQYELEGQTFDNHERAIFQELANGELYLSQTAWGDTQLVIPGNFQEIYNFGPDGILDNCAGSGCNSCSACPGGEFYSLDCSGLPNDLSYSFSCSDNYIGSFFNTFESATTIVRNPESTAPPAFGILASLVTAIFVTAAAFQW